MPGQPARTRPPRPPQAADYGTGPVVLLLEVAALSWGSFLLVPLVRILGPVGRFVGDHYLLAEVAAVVLTALGMYVRRRLRARPARRGRSKVIPFPEHRRRRGA
ncbi:MAG: hypothetical protein K6V73_12570 [Firmicutes bacterium]|nr:hypothetical protein [Bacillota bacterium]